MCIISIITCKSHINVGFIYCERVGVALCILGPKINIKKKKKPKNFSDINKKKMFAFFFFLVNLLREKERE